MNDARTNPRWDNRGERFTRNLERPKVSCLPGASARDG